MFRVAFLEKPNFGQLRLEEQLVAQELNLRGIPIHWYAHKHIERRTLPLTQDTFIMGTMPSMHAVMKQLHIPIPSANDYPASLKIFLRRHVWRSTLKAFEQQLWDGLNQPLFAKPADKKKSFIGQVFSCSEDLRLIGSVTRHQDIWCSEVVCWLSEYRVYIIHDKVVAVDHYAGDSDVKLSQDTVLDALDVYRASGLAPAAFALDFGVLDSGETALVEVNDGYALGAYQISGAIYTDLLFARWIELVGTRTSGTANI